MEGMTMSNETMPKIAAYPLFQDKVPGMPEADIDWLAARITEFWSDPQNDDLENVDNSRLAIKGDASGGLYEEQVNAGCCGSCDLTFGPAPSGATYLYGFNYGH